GAVRLRKRVETVPVEIDVPVERDQVSIERITKDEYVDVAPEVRYEGDTMIVPVIEEILVTAKRFLLREEVRITRTRIAESVHVSESVRRERLDVEEIDEKMKSDVTSGESSPL
ncbi:MAG: YsnF/AvaK domain-containing protein, partial [Chloroflexota bacterium]|nr:YsnF/AvaK domain-containing protein [Chloroflexota bacterium]